MAKLNLNRSPDIVAAIAIFENGKETPLVQKPERSGGLSQCLFFERFVIGGYEVQLRLDWSQLDANGDPTLDANVFKDRKELDKDLEWHTTPKILSGQEWVYEWEFSGFKLRFKVQTTREQHQLGKALIARPPVSSGPIKLEEAQGRAAAEAKFKTLLGIANDPPKETS